MRYRHSFLVQAPLQVVADFHRQSASMGAITPPPVIVRVHSAPELLSDGDEMSFTLWLGPLPIHWRARIEEVTSTGFVDRQLTGPYKSWVHRHSFVEVGPDTTQVVDEVEAELDSDGFRRLLGGAMWLNMPVLFAFRGWRTRRVLAAQAQQQPQSA